MALSLCKYVSLRMDGVQGGWPRNGRMVFLAYEPIPAGQKNKRPPVKSDTLAGAALPGGRPKLCE